MNVKTRIRTLISQSGRDFVRAHWVFSSDRQFKTPALEISMHRAFAIARSNGEWFRIKFEDAVAELRTQATERLEYDISAEEIKRRDDAQKEFARQIAGGFARGAPVPSGHILVGAFAEGYLAAREAMKIVLLDHGLDSAEAELIYRDMYGAITPSAAGNAKLAEEIHELTIKRLQEAFERATDPDFWVPNTDK